MPASGPTCRTGIRERYAEDSPLSVDARRNLIQVNEQCAATQPLDAFGRGGSCAENGGIAGLNYRNQSFWNADRIGAHTWNAAATYVSGANSIKIGYQGAYHADNRNQEGGTNDLTYRFNNGIPNQRSTSRPIRHRFATSSTAAPAGRSRA